MIPRRVQPFAEGTREWGIINAAMEFVLNEKRDDFDEEQHPRDEHGKFAQGSGDKGTVLIDGKTEAEWNAEFDKLAAEQKAQEEQLGKYVAENTPAIKDAITKQCFELGVTPDRVNFSNSNAKFELNGKTYSYAAAANVYTDKHLEFQESWIATQARVSPEYLDKAIEGIKGTVVHEVEHLKYQAVMDAHKAEQTKFQLDTKAVLDRLKSEGHDGLDAWRHPDCPMRVSGELKSQYYDKYPLVATFDSMFGVYGSAHRQYDAEGNGVPFKNGKYEQDNLSKLLTSDGCTSYSKMWYESNRTDTAQGRHSAFHETVAEAERLKATDKEGYKKNVSMIWRNYVRDIDRFAKKIRF